MHHPATHSFSRRHIRESLVSFSVRDFLPLVEERSATDEAPACRVDHIAAVAPVSREEQRDERVDERPLHRERYERRRQPQQRAFGRFRRGQDYGEQGADAYSQRKHVRKEGLSQ